MSDDIQEVLEEIVKACDNGYSLPLSLLEHIERLVLEMTAINQLQEQFTATQTNLAEERKASISYSPCICCGKEITQSSGMDEFMNPDEFASQPYEATVFYTYGHYGSTFWDPMNGDQCVINACDDCLRKYPDRVRYIRKIREHPTKWVEFNPDEENK
jgi:hypothetical protein